MNRAVQGLYAPGSTFKLVTAAAALEEGFLTPETQILDTGRYTYYKSPSPSAGSTGRRARPMAWRRCPRPLPTPATSSFYDAGRRVGIDMLGQYAGPGPGEKTGIELAGEQAGVVAGPEYTASVGGTWYEGSVLSAAIGQENNRFTPLQLAHMVATLVGVGTSGRSTCSRRWPGRPPGKRYAWARSTCPPAMWRPSRRDAGGDPVRLPGRGLPVPPGPGGGQDRVGPSGSGRRPPTRCWCALPPTRTRRSPWPWWWSRAGPAPPWAPWPPR